MMLGLAPKRGRRPVIRFLLSAPLPPETAFAFQGQFEILTEGRRTSAGTEAEDLCALDCAAGAVADANVPGLARAVAILGPFTGNLTLPDPGCPCFLVLGERSRPQVAAAEALRDRLADGRLIRFPDLGDRAYIEEPELVARVLRRELEEIPARGRVWFRRT